MVHEGVRRGRKAVIYVLVLANGHRGVPARKRAEKDLVRARATWVDWDLERCVLIACKDDAKSVDVTEGSAFAREDPYRHL